MGKTSDNNSSNKNEPRVGQTFRNDLKQLKIKEDLGGEYKYLKEYFLTDDWKEKLKSMDKFKDSLWCLGGINCCTSNLHLQDTLIIYSGGLTEAINEIEIFLEKK